MSILAGHPRRHRASAICLSLLFALIAALSACSEDGDSRHTIGGTINGLTTPGLVLAVGLDMVEPAGSATSFTFGTALPQGASYKVVIQTQPEGQTCSVSAGTESGVVDTTDVTSVVIDCLSQWIWQGGSSTGAAAGTYGTQGVASADVSPGARHGFASWTDSSGNFWLFGGSGYDASGTNGSLNDLWEFSPSTGQWTWQGGSRDADAAGTYGTQGTADADNMPGARYAAASWIDSSGNVWLFGGKGYDSEGTNDYLNDLWKYTPEDGQWTWVSGSSTVVSTGTTGTYGTKGTSSSSNLPGARQYAAAWTDSSGNLWLFGGYGYGAPAEDEDDEDDEDDEEEEEEEAGELNDLWKYSPATGEWTWVDGSDTTGASGTYGTVGNNVPGARYDATVWTDSSGQFWLFGGYGVDSSGDTGYLNDLWEYTPPSSGSAGRWSFVAGSTTRNASGTYGTQGTAEDEDEDEDEDNNVPGGRRSAAGWIDSAGDLWLIGGYGQDSSGTSGYLNDLWKFTVSTGQWIWMSGDNDANVSGVYGTMGTVGVASTPGGRAAAATFTDSSGSLWLFGGYGYDENDATDDMNDLWEFKR